MIFLFFISFTLWTAAFSDDLCQTCNCTTDNTPVLTVNCTSRSLQHVGGSWPARNDTNFLKISFARNNIQTLEPMPHTDAVLEIVLTRCNIKYLRPQLFAEAQKVKFVDLSYNQLQAEEISSDKFAGPYNDSDYEIIGLEHLDLSYNQIHSLGKNVFEHMPELRILNLEGNDFTVLDIQTQLAISSVRKLQSLNLANNELTEMVSQAIQAHENLTELDLSLNNLDFIPRSLSHIGKSLEILKLDSNPIIELISESFLGLGNIRELSCNNFTKLKYINANVFASMPKLKKLSVSNNLRLTDIDREAFGVNQSLEEFYLNNNNLYRIDYKLLPWSQLHVFEFKENAFDCSCDLHNITLELSKDITRNEDGPYCMDPRTDRPMKVFYLKSDICSYKPSFSTHKDFIQYHFSMVRMALIILCVIVTVGGVTAAFLGYVRYRRFRESNYPYASEIAYNPVST